MKSTCRVSCLLLALAVSASGQEALNVYSSYPHSQMSHSNGSATPDIAYGHARDVACLGFRSVTEQNRAAARSKIALDPMLYTGRGSDSMKSIAAQFTAVTVTSRPNAEERFPHVLKWTTSAVWRSGGGPSRLDAAGALHVETESEPK